MKTVLALLKALVDLENNKITDSKGNVLGTCKIGKSWNRHNRDKTLTPLKTIYATVGEVEYVGVLGKDPLVRFHIRGEAHV